MRVKFDDAITVSNRLITDEWKAMGTARRLAEGNDQLLDMLLGINEQTRAPARLRFNLDPPGSVAPVVAAPESEAVRQQLHDLREALANGAIPQDEYLARAEVLHNSQAARPPARRHRPHRRRARLPRPSPRGRIPRRPRPGPRAARLRSSPPRGSPHPHRRLAPAPLRKGSHHPQPG
jgi:hypothetical protein